MDQSLHATQCMHWSVPPRHLVCDLVASIPLLSTPDQHAPCIPHVYARQVLLRDAGYTVSALKAGGFSVADFLTVPCSITELKAVGFSAKQCMDAGLDRAVVEAVYKLPAFLSQVSSASSEKDVNALLKEGVSGLLKLIRASGITCEQAKKGGLLPSECHQAGYSYDEAKGAGFPRRIDDWMAMELRNPYNKW
mmetsp:Transcript_56755/g.112704  ORF Transcript_56755/g.112704 Transcript_56755/m.112704 type:complete len:193 (-) Transcript_56755:130-708(-)